MKIRGSWAWLFLPLALGLWSHWPQLENDFVNWDDPNFVIENPLVESPLGSGAVELLLTPGLNYPIPLTVVAYAAQRAAAGEMNARTFHQTSLLFHLVVCLLAAALAVRLGASLPAAAAVAALFAAHPATAEPVAWATGQKDLLMALFGLAALWVRAGPRGDSTPRSLAVFVLAVLCLGSKPTAMVIGPAVLALDVALGREFRTRRHVLLYGALFLLGAGSALSGMLGHGVIGGDAPRAFGLDTLMEAAWAFLLAARHVFLPWPMLVRYFPPEGAVLWLCAGSGVLLAVASAAALKKAYRRRPPFFFCGLAALLFYAPVSGLLPLTRGPADSYLYTPLALLVPVLALLLTGVRTKVMRLGLCTVAVVAVLIGVGTRAETRDWKQSTSLWSDLVDWAPDEPRALMRLGDAHLFQGEPTLALKVYEYLLATHETFIPPRSAHAVLLEEQGQLVRAEGLLEQAARLGDHSQYRRDYTSFLLQHRVPPSNPETARTSMRDRLPWLTTTVKRPSTIERARDLFDTLGDANSAKRMDERLLELSGPP